MKVKIIEADNKWALEAQINEFLNKTNDNNIIDIKYSGVSNHAAHSVDHPSAMIIMKS